jgi:CRP/FNR family transcriptional regulator, cyclic AMP receptor protein
MNIAEDTEILSTFLTRQLWFKRLKIEQQERIIASMQVTHVEAGETAFGVGSPVRGWYAVLTGLVKLQGVSSTGKASTFIGVAHGDWFGEGSVLKAEGRRYEVIALRHSTLACLPRSLFYELSSQHLEFNQFLVNHLNMRLGQAMAAIETAKIRSTDQKVAIYLSRIFWPNSKHLYLTQSELGLLTGLSRQTVNQTLHRLASLGLIETNFGRIVVIDHEQLVEFAGFRA